MRLFQLIFPSIFLLLNVPNVVFSQSLQSQDNGLGYSKAQYGASRAQAEFILEDTRSKLQDMIQRRGGNPQTVLLTGDMVRNWKTAKEAFDSGNYQETVRICNIVQKYIF